MPQLFDFQVSETILYHWLTKLLLLDLLLELYKLVELQFLFILWSFCMH